MSYKPIEDSTCVRREQSTISNDAERSVKLRAKN